MVLVPSSLSLLTLLFKNSFGLLCWHVASWGWILISLLFLPLVYSPSGVSRLFSDLAALCCGSCPQYSIPPAGEKRGIRCRERRGVSLLEQWMQRHLPFQLLDRKRRSMLLSVTTRIYLGLALIKQVYWLNFNPLSFIKSFLLLACFVVIHIWLSFLLNAVDTLFPWCMRY